jgi:hypothetical protein
MLFLLDKDVIATRVWIGMAAGWLLWFIAIGFSGRSRRLAWCVTLVVGLVVLAPTFSTLYSFAVWQLKGFAP